ncbi:GntR family transcriptional regulator [Salinicoccus hispanicus]|uniref:GntR family transcriptional regulator n=1 Tax=Salinicoccus hispanicus TaxID=157225 RepID=A0A6N8TZ42_9STAP|nr:GntR family transcriptional regulator [Salinicoccus hispanicus]MXQ51060.1 GntR family transcriptional regulator [Salinicoccus hispanicus]
MTQPDFNISNESIVRNAIQEMIMNHELEPGDKLPSENELADSFNMKRIAVRNALLQLEKMGLLDSRQGIGRFVKEKMPVIELDMTGKRSFSDKMHEQGVPYESRVIFADYASDKEQEKHRTELGVGGEVDIFKVARLRIVNHVPCAIHISFIREDAVPDISREVDQLSSIFNYYNHKGYRNLTSGGTQIHTTFPTLNEQRQLECHELVPLIVYESHTSDVDKNLKLEQTRILYRSDLFKHSLGSVN